MPTLLAPIATDLRRYRLPAESVTLAAGRRRSRRNPLHNATVIAALTVAKLCKAVNALPVMGVRT